MTIPSNNPHKILVSDKLVLWKKILFYFMHSNQIDFSTCKYSPYSVLLLNIWADYFQQVFLPYLNGLFQKESKLGVGGGGSDILFCPHPPGMFLFFTLPLEIPDKTKRSPLDIPQNCVRSLGNSKVKTKDTRKFHIIFF